MIKLIAILTGLFLLIRPVFPADETNKTPPVTQAATGELRPRRAPSASPGFSEGPLRAVSAAEASGATTPERAGGNEVTTDSGSRPRDPFWPIGFFPASMPGGTSRPAGSERDKETTNQVSSLSGMLRIGGVIKKGDKFYATINGVTVQTGEVISVVADGEVYKFIVEEMDFNKVRFKPVRR